MDENQFHIEEYKWVRSEISDKAKETRTLERNAVIITGAVWAWLLTTVKPGPLPTIAWYIPFILAWFGAGRSLALLADTWHFVKYIRVIEEGTCEGLETWVKKQPLLKNSAVAYVATTAIFWVSLLVVTGFGAHCLSKALAHGLSTACF